MADIGQKSGRYFLPLLPTLRSKSCWSFRLLLLGLTLMFCSACTPNVSVPTPKHQLGVTDSFFVTFVASVAYDQALEVVTNLGLQPAIYCGGEINNQLPAWQPMGQRDRFQDSHGLFFVPGYLIAPDDWQQRLQMLPEVRGVKNGWALYPWMSNETPPSGVVVYSCPASVAGAPSPETPVLTVPNGNDTAVTFQKSGETYEGALYSLINLGLELTDPCYVRSLEQGASPAWHPIGQKGVFDASFRLIIQTQSEVTSSLWQKQLRALPGVVSVETPFMAQC